MNKNSFLTIATAALPLLLTGCSAEIDNVTPGGKTTVISATVSEPGWDTRSSVDPATDGLDFIGLFWNPGDKLGIYGPADNNVPFEYKGTVNARKADFEGKPSGILKYAYYPFTDNNASTLNAVKGNVPTEQIVDGNKLSGDYKVGSVVNGTIDTSVSFTHLFSIVKLSVNAEGVEALTGENLESVSFSVTHNDLPVGIAGDFTFDLEKAAQAAANGTFSKGSEYYNLVSSADAITAKWETTPSLGSPVYGYISVIPEIQSGDKLNFTITTDKQIVTFSVNSQVAFESGYAYNFPLTLKRFADDPNSGWKVEERVDYELLEGTFTCASLNVDGLPSIVNSGGPGSDGTKAISQAIANAGWDFFGVSEDFEYDSQLKNSLSNYNSGKYRGSVGFKQTLGIVADTDGLNFFWKKSGFNASNETFNEYKDKEGDLYNGANTCIKKGFRHYEVTVADDVIIDVYITHMNTYSGSGNTEDNAYVKAVLSQLRQLRDYVVAKMKENKRPAIIMGDTNMRYTRHNIKANLIDVLESGITFNDPWVDFYRGGKFPEWNTPSLMIQSKYGGNTDADILCCDDQRGEVVDKIWYFNIDGAETKISAVEFGNDVKNFTKSTSNETFSAPFKDGTKNYKNQFVTLEKADGSTTTSTSVTIEQKTGLADHFPVVAKFKYSKKVPKK